MTYGKNRRRPNLAARLERAERTEALHRGPLSDDGKIKVDPSTYALLERLYELDPALLEVYVRARYGHIRDPWQEAGHPPPSPERVQEARDAYRELSYEEHCRRLAGETEDRLILSLWEVYARERDELRAGKYIHPACVTSHNLWLFDTGWAEKNRRRNVSCWLSPFRRAVDDRERALCEEGATTVGDQGEAERLADEVGREIVASHLRSGQWLCDRLGVPFEDPAGEDLYEGRR